MLKKLTFLRKSNYQIDLQWENKENNKHVFFSFYLILDVNNIGGGGQKKGSSNSNSK